MAETPDHIILQTALQDKREAFNLAFNQYWETIYQQACRKVRSRELAADLVQETFLTFWNNLEKLAGQEKLLPFLYGVLRNKVLQYFEKDSVHLKYILSLGKTSEADDFKMEDWMHHKQLDSRVKDEINKMPDRMREIYKLKKEEGISITAIADRLGISEQTVKNQLQQAYNRLRDCLKSGLFFFL